MTALDPRAAETLRAAAEVFVPGSDRDPTHGAPDVEAERFLAHYLDHAMPGLAAGVPALLDELAAGRFEGRRFVDCSLAEREAVLDALAEHEVEQLRDLPLVLGFLAIGAVYGEWTGQDAEGTLVRAALGWRLAGFPGPSRGTPRLLAHP